MTTKPMKLVVNLATGKEEYIELTDAEIEQRELDAIAAATARAEKEAEEAAKASAKASALAKLTALGLTEEEAKAL